MPISLLTPLFDINPVVHNSVWKPNCPVANNRLRDVTVSYYDFHGELHTDGHMIVLDAVADHVIQIFKQLYEIKFPLAKIKPMSNYEGDDIAAMRDNNSSSFNCRPITGQSQGGLFSIHAYGLAIDINPIQNPYVVADKVLPMQSEDYVDRTHVRAGMSESIVNLFKEHGFLIWGGHWHTPVDYQHFQTTRFVAKMLAHMNSQHAKEFFEITIKHASVITKFQTNVYPAIVAFYDQYPRQFNEWFESQLTIKEGSLVDISNSR